MKTHTILLIDDDPKNIEILVSALVSQQFQVTTAINGTNGLEKAKKYQPDLIVTDTELPDLNGFDFLARLKENEATATIPVIFLTTRSGLQDRLRAFQQGVKDYIIKPMHVNEIIARIEMILARLERRQLELDAKSGKFTGQLRDISVAELIESLGVKRTTGILNLVNANNKSGQIFFKNGMVVNAILGNFRGELAVYQMLPWEEGTFSMVFEDVEVTDEITVSNLGLLMQEYKRLEKRQSWMSQLPSPQAIFSIRSNFLKILEKKQITPDVAKFLELFDGHRNVLQIIDDSHYEDLVTLERIVKLYQQGFLEEIKQEAPKLEFEIPQITQEPLLSQEEFEAFNKRVLRQGKINKGVILVLGTVGSGKSEFVRTLCGLEYRSRTIKNVFPHPIDIGKILLNKEIEIGILGVSMEKQLQILLDTVENRLIGYIIMVDATEPENFDYLGYLIKSFRSQYQLPYVVAVTKLRSAKAIGIETIAQRLGLESYEELMPCNPSDKKNVKMILLNMFAPYPEQKVYEMPVTIDHANN
ncbi:response regulator [bacterium]|nr:response regulator [bacterium]